VRAIDVPTVFSGLRRLLATVLGRAGAAPTYLASVGDEVRERIRLCLRSRLTSTADGPIE
jgi:hypothetical protein